MARKATEMALIGGMLIDNRTIGEVRFIVKPEDFEDETSREVYECMLALWLERLPVDPVTLLEKAKRTNVKVTEDYLKDTLNTTPSSENTIAYAHLVHDGE